ncbi:LOW QUALITY PROTEIN: hypothetical protein SETIT_6G139400v2 [Setaria italica]|uniref:Uncharacterized protein n=1 Tax=Setaria italica TaxID=4555 RepID=A0A368RLA2_SETIT|nr:LOW QUALITY PROTEIN: hypothetical protein SETIT_6G139400v2 [Setaria italica]
MITGGASGIVKATAFELVCQERCQGHHHRRAGCRAVAAELGAGNACYACCDVAAAIERHGGLDACSKTPASSAVAWRRPPSVDQGPFDRVVAVDARGVLAGAKHATRAMVQCSIVCTASTAGVQDAAAVVGLARASAPELARYGMRVNDISPHAIPPPLAMATMAQCQAVRQS